MSSAGATRTGAPADVVAAFRARDSDKSGLLNAEALRDALVALNLGFTPAEVNQQVAMAAGVAGDPAGSGKIQYEQFATYLKFVLAGRRNQQVLQQPGSAPSPPGGPPVVNLSTLSVERSAQGRRGSRAEPAEQEGGFAGAARRSGRERRQSVEDHRLPDKGGSRDRRTSVAVDEYVHPNDWSDEQAQAWCNQTLPPQQATRLSACLASGVVQLLLLTDEVLTQFGFKDEKDRQMILIAIKGLVREADTRNLKFGKYGRMQVFPTRNRSNSAAQPSRSKRAKRPRGPSKGKAGRTGEPKGAAQLSRRHSAPPTDSYTDALKEMRKGTAMLKYGRRGYPHFRRFQLSKDHQFVQWYSKKKKMGQTSVHLSQIKEVVAGQTTKTFQQCTQPALARASFSIMYGDKNKSLDVVAKSKEEAQLWIQGLRQILTTWETLVRSGRTEEIGKLTAIPVKVAYSSDLVMKKPKSGDSKEQIDESFIQELEKELNRCTAKYKKIQHLLDKPNVKTHEDHENLISLVRALGGRLNEVEAEIRDPYSLATIKRHMWIVKVDLSALEEQLHVLESVKGTKVEANLQRQRGRGSSFSQGHPTGPSDAARGNAV